MHLDSIWVRICSKILLFAPGGASVLVLVGLNVRWFQMLGNDVWIEVINLLNLLRSKVLIQNFVDVFFLGIWPTSPAFSHILLTYNILLNHSIFINFDSLSLMKFLILRKNWPWSRVVLILWARLWILLNGLELHVHARDRLNFLDDLIVCLVQAIWRNVAFFMSFFYFLRKLGMGFEGLVRRLIDVEHGLLSRGRVLCSWRIFVNLSVRMQVSSVSIIWHQIWFNLIWPVRIWILLIC
jgi:hypothetical protein